MTATKKFGDIRELKEFGQFAAHGGRWTLRVEGATDDQRCIDWICTSPFGSVESAVAMNDRGEPAFDRPLYRETPNVNVVAWGLDENGKARFAVLRQERPHADDPERPGEAHAAMIFGQIVMGFLQRIFGKDLIERYEDAAQGAAREAEEEAGIRVVLNIEKPKYPWHNPNPTFVATWSELVFVEVNLKAVERAKHDRHEPIFSAEFITAKELRERVAHGQDECSAVYRMCTANSAWFIFFCTHPELWE